MLRDLIFAEDPAPDPEIELNIEKKTEVKEEPKSDDLDVPLETPEADLDIKKEEEDDVKDEIETFEHNIEEDLTRGIKRRASAAFSDPGDEEFKGFDEIKLEVKAADYCRILGEYWMISSKYLTEAMVKIGLIKY